MLSEAYFPQHMCCFLRLWHESHVALGEVSVVHLPRFTDWCSPSLCVQPGPSLQMSLHSGAAEVSRRSPGFH